MPKRENKATIRDTTMEDAFRQGFEEGLTQAQSTVFYEFTATFEGTTLRRVQFSDLDQALAEARQLLLNGSGVTITIACAAVPAQQAPAPKAVAEPEPDIEDAEVVDEPSGA